MTAVNLAIKKHWTVYFVPGIITLVALFFVYLSFGIATKWISVGLLIFAFLTVIFKIMNILYLASITWSFNGGELHIIKGVLPWNKTHIQIPIFDIYDSSVSSGFLGHYLNFGHISIRRTEGMTSHLSERYLGRAVCFSGIVNQYVQEYKKGQNSAKINHGQSSDDIGLELQRLVDFKKSGALTEEEFDLLKKKLIDSSP
ncbi:hypothetical protein [Flavobacterium sp. T12S277]|uniref:hypothetical protein n=1 Tax=Flavobacterium sp. T12S277 TaxID=3402752 RepID=UPI003ADD6992